MGIVSKLYRLLSRDYIIAKVDKEHIYVNGNNGRFWIAYRQNYLVLKSLDNIGMVIELCISNESHAIHKLKEKGYLSGIGKPTQTQIVGRIKKVLKTGRISQAEVARALGLTPASICYQLKEDDRLTLKTVIQVSRITDTSTDKIIFG